MTHINLISFPRVIDFTIAATYIEEISKDLSSGDVIFDLRSTEVINSSFIGLLIHIKDIQKHRGGRLIVKMSPSIEKTLRRLNLFEYFSEHHTEKNIPATSFAALH